MKPETKPPNLDDQEKIMPTVLFFLFFATFLWGFVTFSFAKTILQEIAGLLIWIMSSIFMVGTVILNAIQEKK